MTLLLRAIVLGTALVFGAAHSYAADGLAVASDLIGKKGTLNADGSYRINVPRSDLKFTNDNGMPIPVDMGLATYVAFSGTSDSSLMVGDFAMLKHEINGVVDTLRKGGVEVVALHNHMTSESPRLFYLHFQAKGALAGLAKTFRTALDTCGKPEPKTKVSNIGKPLVDWTKVESVFGVKPTTFESGVVRFASPRKDLAVKIDDLSFLPGMGLGSWATFYQCECGQTMVMGDTACGSRKELQNVIDALRGAGITITAIHNHILGGSQEVMFLHYEGEGDALKMATGIRKCWNQLGTQ